MNTGANGFMSVKLDNETKTYLEEFQKVHNQHKEKYKSQQLNFGDLIIDLGNLYVSKRNELKECFKDVELNNKLEKLEIAFTIYNEEKVVGEIKEVGTMANELHFTLVVAKSDRYIKEAIEAVKQGKSAKSAVKRDITADDKVTVSDILLQTKRVLALVIKYYNENDKEIKSSDDLEKLNNFVKAKHEEGEWSYFKLIKTFELLDKTKGVKEERYTVEKFNEVINSEEIAALFTENEVNVFTELYRIYN